MSTRRPTIGTNPLDGLFTTAAPSPATSAPPNPRARGSGKASTTPAPATATTRDQASGSTRTKVAYLLPTATVERARNTAVALAGPPHRFTLAGLVTDAIEQLCERLEREHNRGRAFPAVTEPLRGGRPIKAAPTRPTPAPRQRKR